MDDEVVGEGIVDEDGASSVVFAVLDELWVVESISCLKRDTRRTHGIVSFGESKVGSVKDGACWFTGDWVFNRTPIPSPSRIAGIPSIDAQFLTDRLSDVERNAVLAAL